MLRRLCGVKLSHRVGVPSRRLFECYIHAPELDRPNFELKKLCEEGDIANARNTFDMMPKRDTKSYNIMINTYAKRHEFEMAELLLYELNVNGLTPDIYTFTSLIAGYFQANRIEQGEKLISQMKTFHLQPNLVTIREILAGYCACGMLVRARIYFEETQKYIGYDEGIYNAMIAGYCGYQLWDDANTLFETIPKDSLTFEVFDILITRHCAAGLVDRAFKYFLVLQEEQITCPLPYVFLKLIKSLTSVDMDKARQVYNRMVESGFSTKLGAAEDMVLGYCKHRDVAGAIEFVGSLPVYNRDYQLYANIIECAIMEGNIDPILPLYKELVTNGIKMEDFLLSRVVGALLRRDRYKDLLSIIPDVQDVSSIELELSACFQKWFREGKIDQAVQVFKYLNYRSTTLYNCMIEQFFKVNNPTRALELIIQMGEENVAGDENTFNIVLQYDPKMANVDALLDEMYSRGYHIHSVSGAQQMITLFGQKRYKDAEKIFTFMKVRDSTVYRAMLNYYIENHDIRDIERIFGLMQMEGVPIGLEYFIKMQKFKTKKTFFNKMVELYGTAWKRRITLDNTSRVVKEEVSVIDSKA